ncbi:MAG: acyl-CoA carboxylase subunit epsilon [Nocardioides sp.]|uniref:acyl-CoA carboxylase subunit epsilon n=1 Tax=Nocardioides sp. TaxID=35761 RepID=UPI0039E25E58
MTDDAQGPLHDGADPVGRPVLRVINPDATPEEIAALTAVFAALGSSQGKPRPTQRSEWASPHRAVRVRYSSGPGGWRSSGLPR